MKIYFDTNVWIDYIWGFFNKSGKIKNRTKKLIAEIESKNIEVSISVFVIAEISGHFKDWILMQKIIEDGFSYREFRRVAKNYKLDDFENEKIRNTSEKAFLAKWATLQKEGLDNKDLQFFAELTSHYSIDSVDALHGIMAIKNNCQYLVTSDETFITQLNLALKENNIFNEFSAIKPNDFLNHI
jgi:predicted nucleic acid-binding protein